MFNPFNENPLQTRADLQKLVVDLFKPLKPFFSSGAARVRLGDTAAHFDYHAAELEGFARPLWGGVPFLAGGGEFPDWKMVLRGLTNGTDPEHCEYWGEPKDYDQRLVEMAAIGFSLLLIPEQIWQPLTLKAQSNLVNWLGRINSNEIVDNNWLWFRVLVNLGLKNVGAEYDQSALHKALDRLEEFYVGKGWYSDGQTLQRDYYISFAMHYYGLLYAKFAKNEDPERAQRFRERAVIFAQDFVHWFAADGAAIPFGRSLTYRFAQASFWGALAFADLEALPWGVIKGLILRHLSWWSQQSIFTSNGVLTIGYAYPNLNMAEQYNSPGSPYWAMKFFLPLALPESHPFWQAEPLPLPDLPAVHIQTSPQMIFTRDQTSGHVVALTSGQSASWARHGGEKYAKFAYSPSFAFSVPLGSQGLSQAAADSMLALSDDGRHYRVREHTTEVEFEQDALRSIWQPMPGVTVETWLIPATPWHLRVHHLRTDRPLWSAEGGFSVDRSGDDVIHHAGKEVSGAGFAAATYPAGGSGLLDLAGERSGTVIRVEPNGNLIAPRTVLPTLCAQHPIRECWLACAALADPDFRHWESAWQQVPGLPAVFIAKMKGSFNGQ